MKTGIWMSHVARGTSACGMKHSRVLRGLAAELEKRDTYNFSLLTQGNIAQVSFEHPI